MVGRVAVFEGTPEQFDEFLDRLPKGIGKDTASRGLREFIVLIDREAGRGPSLAMWESREALQQSKERSEARGEKGLSGLVGLSNEIHIYDVEIHALAGD